MLDNRNRLAESISTGSLYNLETRILSNRIAWFGAHTGYEQLPKYLQQAQENVSVVSAKPGVGQRLMGKAYSYYRRWPPRNQSDAAAEMRFSRGMGKGSAVNHILYSETHLPFLDAWTKSPKNIIGTLHLPPAQWDKGMIAHLRRLSSGIVLYQRDLDFFETHIGKGRVKFIRHGVDTEFFLPPTSPSSGEQRLLFAGCYLRNTAMLHRVITRLSRMDPDLRFDLLVPAHAREREGLPELRNHPAVTWHQKLSDEALRSLYQNSYLLLQPMNNSGANTAIVEALACGLPIVTTDVGGVCDYGGGKVYPILNNNDDDAMLDLVEQYLSQPDWRDQVSQACRLFAETCLTWPLIAEKHLQVYQDLIS